MGKWKPLKSKNQHTGFCAICGGVFLLDMLHPVFSTPTPCLMCDKCRAAHNKRPPTIGLTDRTTKESGE